jgi:hypothetical protein
MRHQNNKNTDNEEIRNISLLDDDKRLLQILELVESQYKLATRHYELWKNLLLTKLTKEK